jgi:hypothetical protein
MAQLAQPTGTKPSMSSKIIKILLAEPSGLSASHLAIRLGTSKRTIYYNLRQLQKQQKVINMRPLWICCTNLRQSQIVQAPLCKHNIEIHNLVFSLKLIQKPYWWNTRHTKLLKLKDYQIRPKNFGHNPYIQLMDDICFVNMYKSSIMFIMRKEYRDNDAYACLSQGIEDFMLIYRKVEQLCGFQFFKDGVPQASIVKCHGVKLQDAMAKKLTKDGKHFQVFHEGKLRMLIDMSHPKGIEAVNPEYSIDDIDRYVRYTEDIITNNTMLPSEVAEMLSMVVKSQAMITKNMAVFDANMASHISAVQQLGAGVEELTRAVKQISEARR